MNDDASPHRSRRPSGPTIAEQRGASRSRVLRWLALTASVALVGIAFSLPTVRAGAAAFLDLFRVANFAGISFDPTRLRDLAVTGLDLPGMIGGDVEILEQAGPPTTYASLTDASAATGLATRAPAWLPPHWQATRATVVGANAVRITTHGAKLQTVLDALEIHDVKVPADIDGTKITIRVPPIVSVAYENADGAVMFLQARNPEIEFPAGLDLASLAEIGLRVLGIERKEAYRFAQSIDWRTTLVVPVPVNAASFRQVDVQGQGGLVIEGAAGGRDHEGRLPQRRENMLLWASGASVYALRGSLPSDELLAIAQSVQ